MKTTLTPKQQNTASILKLQKSKKTNYILGFTFLSLLIFWPIVIPSIYVFGIAIPSVFFFACTIAFFTETVEDQKEIEALKKSIWY